jgi:fatty acid desaturase
MVALALLHGAILASFPSAPLIALGVWWNSNTVSHNFVHRPFFRSRGWNVLFGAYLSILLGIPQAWWRARHLAHHGIPDQRGIDARELGLQAVLIAASWSMLLVYARTFFVWIYLPGYVAGLCCARSTGITSTRAARSAITGLFTTGSVSTTAITSSTTGIQECRGHGCPPIAADRRRLKARGRHHCGGWKPSI